MAARDRIGLNPFVTHLVDAPAGINLAWATSVPGLALALAPVTLTLGPVLAYNLAALLAAPLAAWTAFLLARYLTRSWPAAAICGAFFGFSPYLAGQLADGHLHLTMVFLVPLLALVVLRYLHGELGARGLAVRLGLVVAGQLLVSTEVALTLTLALLIGLALAALAAPTVRPRLTSAAVPIAAGYGLAAILTSPLLVYAVIGYRARSLEPPAAYPADLLNLVVPTDPTLVSGGWTRSVAGSFTAGVGESGAYIGVLALAIVAMFLWRRRTTAGARFLAPALALGIVCELGTRLFVHGHGQFALPWSLLASWPGFRNVLPVRLSLYVSLAVAVAIALWAGSGGHRRTRLAIAALALLTVLPSPRREIWSTSPPDPAFFADRLYERCLRPGETTLLVPVPVQSYGWLWQTQADYRFRMIDGNLVQSPHDPALFLVDISGHVSPHTAVDLLRLVRADGATTIVVTAHFAFWQRLLDGLLRPQSVGGVLLYRLDGAGIAPGRCKTEPPVRVASSASPATAVRMMEDALRTPGSSAR